MAWAQCPLWHFSVVACRGRLDIPGVVRYAHSCCQIQLGSVLQHVLNYYASSATGTETTASVLKQRLLTWLSPPFTGASEFSRVQCCSP